MLTRNLKKLPTLQGIKRLKMGFITENALTMVLIGQISNSLDQNDPH